MNTDNILQILRTEPQQIQFDDVIQVIDANYSFEPTEFDNGSVHNESGQNNGSCKIFSFASMHDLDEQQTLHCFGHYYRDEVLGDPDGDSHQNIRQFMVHGWNGIKFSGNSLTSR